jgi:hypothetical protein
VTFFDKVKNSQIVDGCKKLNSIRRLYKRCCYFEQFCARLASKLVKCATVTYKKLCSQTYFTDIKKLSFPEILDNLHSFLSSCSMYIFCHSFPVTFCISFRYFLLGTPSNIDPIYELCVQSWYAQSGNISQLMIFATVI